MHTWNIPAASEEQGSSSFKAYLEFLEDQVEKSQNQDSGDSPSFDLTRFLRNPFAPSGSRDNLFESFESKLEQTLNQIGLVLHGFYKVLIKENTLVLKEIIECLYLLTESARTLFQGKIFDCLKLIDSFHESIGSINIQEVSAKFNQIIELIRVLSMEALYNREYQNRTSKIKNKESFSSRVLELEKCYSPCLSIDKEHMQDIDDKLLMKIKTELTLKSLQEFLKTYSISESQIVSGSEICRICLNRVNNIDLQHHVKKCSEKYKTEKQLEEVRGEIISLRQGMKNREIQLRNTINKLTDNPPGSDGKTHLALHIFECLLRDLDKRSYKNYYSKPREVILQSKQIQNLLIQDQQLIGKQELLQRYSNLFHQQKELKSIIMKLECQNFKGSETDSKRSKYSQKRSLDTFEVKTPRKKSNKKSRFAAISKEQEDDSGKPNCYFPDKGNQLSLVRKHSSEKYIHDYEEDFKFKNFEVLKLLGKGAFGRVYLVRRIYTRDLYAMKVIPIQSAQYALIKNQHDIFAKISGDSFVRAVFSFTEGNLHMFFLEFMNGGDFSQLLERQVYLEEAQSRYYFAEIALAIEKLHETGIIHRDIKPSNIVLDSSGYLKLTDFGLSKLGITHVVKHSEEICKAKKAEEQLMAVQVHCPSPGLTRKGSYQKKTLLGPHAGTNKRIIGTPDYIAPEIIRQQSFDNPSIDWWSYGVIIYQALIGTKPFGAMKVQDVFSNILQNKIIWPQIGYDQGMISPQAQDFIKKLLQPDFTKRLGYNGISQIKSHKFWQGLNWNNVSSMIPPIRFPSEDVSLMEENIDLKKEIYQMIKKQTKLGSQKRLKSLVRLDVLSEITLSRASISSNGNRRRARKSCFAQLRQ